MVKKQKWQRKGRVILTLETNEREAFKSLNKAKKASRELQLGNSKMLGLGDLVVAR